MKKTGLVFNMQKFSLNDGEGIRTLVFLQGCPLRCKWCSNPESQELTPQMLFTANKCIGCGTCERVCSSGAISADGFRSNFCVKCGKCEKFCPTGARKFSSHIKTSEEVMQEILKDKVFYNCSNGGVTFSGGEPLAQWEFTTEILKSCHAEKLNTAIETTCFSRQDIFATVVENVDTVLCDIKHMDDEKHKMFTGVSNKIILENIKYLGSTKKHYIVRIPFITEVNADEYNVKRTAEFAQKNGAAEVHLLPYHRLGEPKYYKLGRSYDFIGTRPDDEIISNAKSIFEDYGLKVIIGG